MGEWATLCYSSNMLFLAIVLAISMAGSSIGCLEVERKALLSFKAGINDPSHRLSSWHDHSEEDCCRWSGVVCDSTTHHVVELNLQSPYSDGGLPLMGELLSPSLLSLTHLVRLNLSSNDFVGNQIPEFFGSFQKLRYLDLSYIHFGGAIPPQLGNLSTLLHLDLRSASVEFPAARVDGLDWLAGLHSLTYLDLSGVNLRRVSSYWLPAINMLPSLQELHLSECSLDNIFPSFLCSNNLNNLSTSLATLDLSANYFNSTLPDWLWQLNSLSSLQLSGGTPQYYGKIPAAIGNLTRLRQLSLSSNSLSGLIPPELGNLTRLRQLVLSGNSLSGLIPSELGKLTRLRKLGLSSNLLSGPIPSELGNLTRLRQLGLYGNLLSGLIPSELGKLTSLTQLDLSYNLFSTPSLVEIGRLTGLELLALSNNSLEGPLPMDIGKLFNLRTLDLSFNSLEGNISERHFFNLTKLETLHLSGNSMINMAVDHNWVPPFQLKTILLNSCKLGLRFPGWLRSQKSILEIDLSNTDIKDVLPDWFWNFSSTIEGLDLSHNQILGSLPTSLESMINLKILNLGSNLLKGPIFTRMPPKLQAVDLSNNSFSGPLSSIVFPKGLTTLLLSHNLFNGSIPSSICSTQLFTFDISNNQISGKIPQCWQEFNDLLFLNLAHNNLFGEIPSSIGNLTSLQSLYLNNNKLSGHLPSSLQNCDSLEILDLGDNNFSGGIPSWIGHRLQELLVLRLHSNMFLGNIPSNLGQMRKLQVIDLANNNLLGPVPQSFGNFSTITTTSQAGICAHIAVSSGNIYIETNDRDNVSLNTKGEELSFTRILYLVKSIDLSNNHLNGEIPDELGSLVGLQTLNLSRNYLTGKIPDTISGMKSLETLDLSFNKLYGEIPQALSALTSLSHLNLSYNNLSGRIPSGNQIQTLDDASIYSGNAFLCGALINKSCFGNGSSTYEEEYEEQVAQILPVHLGGALGFLTGLWSVFIILLSKRDWRCFYFRKMDEIYDKAYVAIKIRMNRGEGRLIKGNT